MSEPKQIETGDHKPDTESGEFQALKKEIDLLKLSHEDISQLLVTGKWSDVTICVENKTVGKVFAVHRKILSTRSPFFAELLEKNCKRDGLVINDVDVDAFEILLNFIYTGKVPALEPKVAQDLLVVADEFKVEQLKAIAEDYLNSLASPPTTPRPLPPIARLHDPCLVALFKQLPPADKITARTVCRRWADLVPYAARSTRTLAILVYRCQEEAEDQFNIIVHGSDWPSLQLLRQEDGTPLFQMHSLNQWNSLVFDTLNKETIAAIMATFPTLKELQLSAQFNRDDRYCNCCVLVTPPLDHLVQLLEHWRPQLATLKFDVSIASIFPVITLSVDRLGAAISSLSELKNLYFNLQWNTQPICPPLLGPSQLSHFSSVSVAFVDVLNPLNSPPPLQIGYDGYYEWQSITEQLILLDEDLRRRFVRIEDRYAANYRTVCTHFPSLTSVNLFIFDGTFRDFLAHASQLTQLVRLKLNIDLSTIPPDDQPQHLLPQLKTVKLLHLGITNRQNHRDLEPLNLPWSMPNLQVILFELRPLRCSTCNIYNRYAPDEKMKYCLYRMFAPLKRDCRQLHTIWHDLEERLGTVEEILAEEPPIIETDDESVDAESSSDGTDTTTDSSTDEPDIDWGQIQFE